MDITSKQAIAAQEKAALKATELGVNANVAVLDTTGYLKGFLRMDDAFLGSIDIALGKAKTAMLFRMNSEAVGQFLAPEAATYGMVNTSGGLVGFKGGVPIKTGEAIVGYIGVSGGSPDQDFEIAKAGSLIG
ncbi:MAG: heme-binding protein [Flavitalea sp.]